MTKETHIHRLSRMATSHPHTPDLMRDTYVWQKRPAYVTKETHIHRLSRMATSHPHTPDLMHWRPRSKTWWISCSMTRDTYVWQKRPAYVTKETHIHRLSRMAKSHSHTPDLMHWRPRSKTWRISCSMTRDTYICDNRDLNIWQKRHAYVTKETHIHRLSRMATSLSRNDTRNLHLWQQKSTYLTKETCICDKRDAHTSSVKNGNISLTRWQEKLKFVTTEIYTFDKRDLHMWQKRPTYIVCHEWQNLSHAMTRETYICDNRDLHIWQKRPAYVTKETHIHRLSRIATSLSHNDKRNLHL